MLKAYNEMGIISVFPLMLGLKGYKYTSYKFYGTIVKLIASFLENINFTVKRERDHEQVARCFGIHKK